MAITEIKEFIADNRGGTSQVPPFLLNFWREEVYEEIWHFAQVSGDDVSQIAGISYVQSERDKIARACYTAYQQMSRELRYTLMPQWFVEDIPLGEGTPYAWQQLQSRWGYIEAFGQRATTLIEAGAAITYSKSNSALLQNDTATITVTSAAASVDEVAVFFTTTDGAPSAAHPNYQIVPLEVSKSGNTITITGHRALFVEPSIWKFPYVGPAYDDKNLADTSDATHFVTTVDVYRVYTDTTIKAQIVADPIWTDSADYATDEVNTAVVWPVDLMLGLFKVRIQDTSQTCIGPAQKARVYYKAGYPAPQWRMDSELAQGMTRFANAELPDKPADFNDRGLSTFEFDRYAIPNAQERAGNLFGFRNGHLFAWNLAMSRALHHGGKITRGVRNL